MILKLRWKLWGIASRIAFLLCPNKKALNIVMRLGIERVKAECLQIAKE